MNSQHLSKWNYKKLGRIVCAFLIILFHPQKALTLIENLAFINLYGITALGSQLHSPAFPQLFKRARISKSLLALGLWDDLVILTPRCLPSPMEARIETVDISPSLFPR